MNIKNKFKYMLQKIILTNFLSISSSTLNFLAFLKKIEVDFKFNTQVSKILKIAKIIELKDKKILIKLWKFIFENKHIRRDDI